MDKLTKTEWTVMVIASIFIAIIVCLFLPYISNTSSSAPVFHQQQKPLEPITLHGKCKTEYGTEQDCEFTIVQEDLQKIGGIDGQATR